MKKYFNIQIFLFVILSAWLLTCLSASIDKPIQAGVDKPLSAEEAFKFTVSQKDSQTLVVKWHIAPDYYLYRHAIFFREKNTDNHSNSIQFGQPLFPPGKVKTIPSIGQFVIYENSMTMGLPIINSANVKNFLLEVHYQGCSVKGYCYPPMTQWVDINLSAGNNVIFSPLNNIDVAPLNNHTGAPSNPNPLFAKNWMLIIISFFGFGILLSLTPCVLPMIPILSSIILGQSPHSPSRNFSLSFMYVLSMAITYAFIGVVFGFLGFSLQATLQQTWIIILVSLILLVMSFSMFGFYQFQIPEWVRARVAYLSHQQRGGTYVGVIIMGCLSTLILSPCVTPPLVAALGYISQTGSLFLGGATLFALGMGMGVPLLIIGAWGSKLLPKTGPWMNTVKTMVGFILLVLMLWLLSRVIPIKIIYFFSTLLILTISIYLGALSTANNFKQWIHKIFGLLILSYGLFILFSTLQGSVNPFRPIFHATHSTQLEFIPVNSISDLEQKLVSAHSRPVMIDFYADWCIACKQLDSQVFTNPKVQQALKKYVLLRADVTTQSFDHQALQRQFEVIGPPTLLFFNEQHEEMRKYRIIGGVGTKEFLKHLSKVTSDNSS